MDPTLLQVIGTILFACAVIHTFLVKRFETIAHKYPRGSVGENLFHFLGEVEVVFGLWAGIFVVIYSILNGMGSATGYLESLNFTEPVFVFVIMCMAGTRPVIMLAESIITYVAKLMPLGEKKAFYISTLIIGPLLGSFITEPAAMTVTALIMLDKFYSRGGMSDRFKYATLGLLFVNISIGGTLTHFAAPPVLMVAAKWGWGINHMMIHYGYKSAIAILISTIATSVVFSKELEGKFEEKMAEDNPMDKKIQLKPTWWIYAIHIIFLIMVVVQAHHMVFFLGLFLFFLGFAAVTTEYQDELKLKESLLVGFFLAGLVTLGGMQQWWLQVVLTRLGDIALYLGATLLTGITDNAALTYLGSLVENLSDSAKYYLVAGAVVGGGLTVIANAPNPAGFGILKKSFGENGISPLGILAGAAFPTLVAFILLLLLPPTS